jgi:hypothetical protein
MKGREMGIWMEREMRKEKYKKNEWKERKGKETRGVSSVHKIMLF